MVLPGGDLQHQPEFFFLSFSLDYYHLLVRIIRPINSKTQDFTLKNKDMIENAFLY